MSVKNKPVCQAVLHFKGRFYRSYKGQRAHNHVLVFTEDCYAPRDVDRGADGDPLPSGYESVSAEVDGHCVYSGAGQFCVMSGRRYSDVTHWFLQPLDVESLFSSARRHEGKTKGAVHS